MGGCWPGEYALAAWATWAALRDAASSLPVHAACCGCGAPVGVVAGHCSAQEARAALPTPRSRHSCVPARRARWGGAWRCFPVHRLPAARLLCGSSCSHARSRALLASRPAPSSAMARPRQQRRAHAFSFSALSCCSALSTSDTDSSCAQHQLASARTAGCDRVRVLGSRVHVRSRAFGPGFSRLMCLTTLSWMIWCAPACLRQAWGTALQVAGSCAGGPWSSGASAARRACRCHPARNPSSA